jgi:hypothetical protein
MKPGLPSLSVLMILLSLSGIAQNFPVGHRSMNFTDTSRNNRAIPSEIYYPGTVAGNNVTVADGRFPVISFGHGFLMDYSVYLYLADSLVPRGYIMAFTKTESGISPNHSDYGKDLAYLIVQMQAEGNSPASPFYGHTDSTSAIMGHSMGGGASFLACEHNTVPTAMVTFAAAETTPSAIHAATGITLPGLVFSADQDCVTPPAQNQIPMYDSLSSACKVFISITGGGHCYFAESNFQCSLGELGCSQNFTITREEQHATTLDFLVPYLKYYLKKDGLSWTLFTDSLESSSRITHMLSCTTSTGSRDLPGYRSFLACPNPARDRITVSTRNRNNRIHSVTIRSATGISVYRKMEADSGGIESETLDLSGFPSGVYILCIEGKSGTEIVKMIRY